MESQLVYEQGDTSLGLGPVSFELGYPGDAGHARILSPAQWVWNPRSLHEHSERLLEDEASIGFCDNADWDEIFMERAKVRFAKCMFGIVLCTVFLVLILIGVGFYIPWGKEIYSQELVDLLDVYAEHNISFSSTCLYKQFNNGAWWSDERLSGMTGRQREGEGRSPDILYYHHQGNLLEVLYPGNATSWMQISMNRHGLGFRVTGTPLVIDTIRWTKECYFWCGTLSRENRSPRRFAQWLRAFHEPYNGFLLNCLQFSQKVWEFFDADNLGCAPAELVNRQQLAQEPFPKFDDEDNASALPVFP